MSVSSSWKTGLRIELENRLVHNGTLHEGTIHTRGNDFIVPHDSWTGHS